MSERFKKDDYVVYGKMGVCQIDRRERLSFGATTGDYYVLTPMSDRRSSVYVPCDNPELMTRLRPIFTKDEIDEILRSVPKDAIAWIDDKNERASYFRELITRGDRRELLCLVRCLYEKKQEKVAVGKKLSAADEAMLHDCVCLVEDEFSLALGIARSDVGAYIRSNIDVAD